MSCEHDEFETRVTVVRLTDDDGGAVTGYCADIRIRCSRCATPFEFVGVPMGISMIRPMMSADSLELRAPIKPHAREGN